MFSLQFSVSVLLTNKVFVYINTCVFSYYTDYYSVMCATSTSVFIFSFALSLISGCYANNILMCYTQFEGVKLCCVYADETWLPLGTINIQLYLSSRLALNLCV